MSELRNALLEAITDPGSKVVRRGMTRDGQQVGLVEPYANWQLGAVLYLLCLYFQAAAMQSPEEWEDAIEFFQARFRDVDLEPAHVVTSSEGD